MIELGKGEGVSGLLDMIVDGITSATPTFAVRVYGWSSTYGGRTISRAGRAGRNRVRVEDFTGKGTAEGYLQTAAYPYPTLPNQARGTLTLTQNATTNTVKFPVQISNMKWDKDDSRDKNPSDIIHASLNWVMAGEPTIVWNGTQTTITAATQNFLQTDVGLGKVYDPNFIRTRATQRIDVEGIADNDTGEYAALVSYIATAISPMTAGKVHTVDFHRTGSGGGYFNIQWALRDTADDTRFPHLFSTRASETPFIDHYPEIINSTLSTANLANILWTGNNGTASFQSVAFAKGLHISPLSDGKYLAVYEYRNPGATVSGTSRAGGRLVEAIMNGTAAQLFVASNLEYGSSARRLITLSRRRVFNSVVRRFVLFRQLTGTTIPDQGPATINGVPLPLIGEANNAAFLANGTNGGLAAGTCVYHGPKYRVNLGLSQWGNFPIAIGYEFQEDSLGIVTNVPQSVFIRDIVGNIVDTNSLPHYQYAAVLGYPDIVAPTQSSFTAFTSGI